MLVITLFIVAVLATIAGTVLLGRLDLWQGVVPWADRGLRIASVASAVVFALPALGAAEGAERLLVLLPILVTVLAAFLPLSDFGNLVAGWAAAGFLVLFVILTVDGIGPYFVLPALLILAAAVTVPPLPARLAELLDAKL